MTIALALFIGIVVGVVFSLGALIYMLMPEREQQRSGYEHWKVEGGVPSRL